MPIEDAIALLEFAEEAEREEVILQRWIPVQFNEPYEDFKARLLAKKKSNKEIMEDAENILTAFLEGSD